MNTKKNKIESTYDIVTGPNRDMLFDACKYAYDEKARIPIDFGIVAGYTMPKDHPGCAYIRMFISDIKITSIEYEDGSGESFNLHGYCKANPKSSFGNVDTCASYRFEAYYNTKNRSGNIVLSK